MNIRKRNDIGYLIYFYWKDAVVYICACRTLTGDILNNMMGRKFNRAWIREVPLLSLEAEKKKAIRDHNPVYNKRRLLIVCYEVHKRSLLAEKLEYCRVHGIPMAELEKNLRKP